MTRGKASSTRLTPASAIRRGEIVEEIVDNLRPWKHRISEATVTAAVSRALDERVDLIPTDAELAERKLNRIHARRLNKALASVETLLASAPDLLAAELQFFSLPPDDEEATAENYNAVVERRIRKCWERENSRVAELSWLREVCAYAISPGLGSHPNYSQAEHGCAYVAHDLMREFSKQPITGTEGGRFRAIANLLYEAISGLPDEDLKRACDDRLHGKGSVPVTVANLLSGLPDDDPEGTD